MMNIEQPIICHRALMKKYSGSLSGGSARKRAKPPAAGFSGGENRAEEEDVGVADFPFAAGMRAAGARDRNKLDPRRGPSVTMCVVWPPGHFQTVK